MGKQRTLLGHIAGPPGSQTRSANVILVTDDTDPKNPRTTIEMDNGTYSQPLFFVQEGSFGPGASVDYPIAVSKGGTGATTAEEALANLGIVFASVGDVDEIFG